VGIYFSMALEARPMLPLALALAARDAIRTAAGIECDIRWPNDLLVDGKKAGGILVEAAGERATAGVGVNVNNRAFPPELADEATSLALSREYARRAAGAPLSREAILLELIPAIEAHVRLAPAEVLRRFSAASSYVSGRRVRVNRPEGVLEGLTAGLDPSGFLKLRRDDGSEIPILAGGVRAAGAGCGQ
jgi:BirA family biotin operon repressor/biotin-[acetyl-CoA-carboxylase] ligase